MMNQYHILITLALALFSTIAANDSFESRSFFNVCYDEYGCFTSGPPFGLTLQRPFALLPDSPNLIDTKFLLYTRDSFGNAQLISRKTNIGNWIPNRPTKILVHGFLDTVNSTWWTEMKDALLKAEDCNVIMVHWSPANYFPYTKATANAQVVGADIALLVNMMIKDHGAKSNDFHIIAHSLGTAVAGYAGSRIVELGRITGLDPAGPFLENTDPLVRLDPTDAKFVDIIHTDGSSTLLLGFGTLQEMGHVDFYPNGGMNQPSCDRMGDKLFNAIINLGPLDIFGPMDIQGFFNTTLCSHFAAVHLFTQSILDICENRAFACKTNEDFQKGKCILNGNQGNYMGYRASPRKAHGRLYLNANMPYRTLACFRHYQIGLESGSSFMQTKGLIGVTFSSDLTKQSILFDSEEVLLQRSTVESRLVTLDINLSNIQYVTVEFERTGSWISSLLYSNKWVLTHVLVTDGDRQENMKFCPENGTGLLEPGQTKRFVLCQ